MKHNDGGGITNPENAQSFSFTEIKQAADQMNPSGLRGALDAWSAIATTVTAAGHQFEAVINQAVRQYWEGAAADHAVRGVRDYAVRIGDLGAALSAQSIPLSAAADAAAKFKMSVPDVAETSNNSNGAGSRNSREEQARDDMSTQYIQPYGSTAQDIPILPPPINPVASQAPSDEAISIGPGNVLWNSPENSSATDGPSAVDTNGKPKDQAGPNDNGESETATDSNNNSKPETAGDPNNREKPEATANDSDEPETRTDSSTSDKPVGQAGPDDDQPDAIAPQSVSHDLYSRSATTPVTTAANSPTSIPATSTLANALPQPANIAPASIIPASLYEVPSSPGTPGPSGPPSLSGAPGSVPSPAVEPQPGTSRPAPPAGVASSSASLPPTAAGRTGIAGAAGYSGMMAPGIPLRGKDDERKGPKFLRTEEHTKELIGEIAPTVPPVIGVE